MRIAIAELAPRPGDVAGNIAQLRRVAMAAPADLVVFPELYVSGYRIGDRFHQLALDPATLSDSALAEAARGAGRAIIVGAPLRSAVRPGEITNAVLLARSDGRISVQGKRYLPTYGPFEEGSVFTPTDTSRPVALGSLRLGLEICYDAFFPEVSRDLALGGAQLLVAVSAAPVTSRRLFEKVLPARAVENAVPLVYVNRVGVEDGVVFGGGSGAWDARGEPIGGSTVPVDGLGSEESVRIIEIDPDDAVRWRPFRPVLRDVATRPPAPPSGGAGGSAGVPHPSTRETGL